jgi:hypothetical protein
MPKLEEPKNIRDAECRNCNYCRFLITSDDILVCDRGSEDNNTDQPFCRDDDDEMGIHTTVCDGFERKKK